MFSSVKQEIQSSTAFHGVRFALFGFDPPRQDEIRSKLVGGGGVDVSQYGPNCTHVIVDKLVYDDPVCVAARQDGKVLVTSLWVHHSLDVGMPVEASPVMYRPVKDMNGISGAKSLIVCLTGYLRQDRDDIMTMVSLMGAQFSKPLIANRVTHLICYKFEGEKYELAKKMMKIKLINHRWLEDCLKAWEILPEENYCKSGYELEMEMEMEAEAAKDSQDEAEEENENAGAINFRTSPLALQNKLPSTHRSPLPGQKTPHPGQNEVLSTSDHLNNVFRDNEDKQPSRLQDNEGIQNAKSSGMHAQNTTPSPPKDLLSSCSASKRSADSNVSKYGSLCYSRKFPKKSPESLQHDNTATIITPSKDHDFPKTPLAMGSVHDQGSHDLLSYKRKMDDQSDISRGSSKSPKLDSSANASTEQHNSVIPRSILEASTEKSCAEKTLEGNRSNNAQAQTSNVEKKTPQKKLLLPDPSPMSNGEKETLQNKEFNPENNLMSDAEKETPINQQPPVNSEVTKSRNSKRVSATDKSSSRSPKKKSIGQKTLGSRPRSKMSFSANKKAPLCPSGTSPVVNSSVHESNEIPGVNQQKDIILHIENDIDDETEAPPELEIIENVIGKNGEGEMPTKEAQGIADMTVKNASASEGKNEKGTKKILNRQKKAVGTKNRKIPEPNPEPKPVVLALKAVGRKSEEENRRVLSNSGNRSGALPKNKVSPSVKVEKENQPVETDQNIAKPGKRTGDSITRSAKMMKKTTNVEKQNQTVGALPKNKVSPSVEVEKENQPVDSDQNIAKPGKRFGDSITRSAKVIKKTTNVVQSKNVEKQPSWFILSGHKLQRKEYQKMIKRLKGKLCRDSHHWSYQATHFIVPDPVRRTEKFFAAAASGSWILNTDYLTASDQAGKLLPEEPYEWHKTGLNEDGAINLEAPRKWRLLREKTGHGAFHGMRIIIYGECIAPPLDTLKRAVKAGDGTILATSPPYTKFLDSGVDFAIVSPGMPRVDIWVQEFLKHNIPCVLADYLVEYVCKPGFPLEKHVQYNTHEWAAKSFSNLVRRSEEVVSEDEDDDDLRCKVCGSSERGDVMLICGTENGSAGCGVGTHIDCCDPPIKEVPEGDWFCEVCMTGVKKKKTLKSRKR